MRTAIISDIHGNLAALENVLKDARRRQVDSIVCLGDIVGYGPKPVECLRRVRESTHAIVLGNHDLLAAQRTGSLRGFREDVADGILLARNLLEDNDIRFLLHLPYTLTRGDSTFVHASLNEPSRFQYLHEAGDVMAHFENQETALCFGGHSHIPVVWRKRDDTVESITIPPAGPVICRSGFYFFNVGSVGQPRDGDPRACYVIHDSIERSVDWFRVHYDVAQTMSAMATLGMPDFSSARLLEGE